MSAGEPEANARLKDGAIQLTYIDGHLSALLTVRRKDHDLTPAEMLELADALTNAAKSATTAFLLGEAGR